MNTGRFVIGDPVQSKKDGSQWIVGREENSWVMLYSIDQKETQTEVHVSVLEDNFIKLDLSPRPYEITLPHDDHP